MLRTRVIPSLLLSEGGLVKTRRFKDPVYIGDPINAVRIFNDKGADELAFLDISATRRGTGPDFAILEDIASEAFMPFSYGGGITTVAQVKRLYSLGIEKVVINTGAVDYPGLVTEAATLGGSSGVVASMDVRRDWRGRHVVMVDGGRRQHKADVVAHAQWLAEQGAGEILLNAIDRDGMMEGYDLDLIGRVSKAVTVPVVAVGGAGSVGDFGLAVAAGAAAVSAGSLFVFHGRQRGVLITYPEPSVLQRVFE